MDPPKWVPLRIPLLPTDCKGNIKWCSFLPRHLHAKMVDSPLLNLHVFCEVIQSCELDYPGNSHSHCKDIGTFTTYFFSSWYRNCALQGLIDVSWLSVEAERTRSAILNSKSLFSKQQVSEMMLLAFKRATSALFPVKFFIPIQLHFYLHSCCLSQIEAPIRC